MNRTDHQTLVQARSNLDQRWTALRIALSEIDCNGVFQLRTVTRFGSQSGSAQRLRALDVRTLGWIIGLAQLSLSELAYRHAIAEPLEGVWRAAEWYFFDRHPEMVGHFAELLDRFEDDKHVRGIVDEMTSNELEKSSLLAHMAILEVDRMEADLCDGA